MNYVAKFNQMCEGVMSLGNQSDIYGYALPNPQNTLLCVVN